jgi:hypothetical protein
MSELPEKQIKRLKSLIQEAETNLACAKELLVSLVGDDPQVTAAVREEVAVRLWKASLMARTWLVPTARHILYLQIMHLNRSLFRAISLN